MNQSQSAHLAARLREETERIVDADEAQAYLAVPIGDSERESILSLIRWFRRRYPRPADRLAYVRRAYARWRRTRGHE
jgi:hypothetical protein